MQADDVGAKDGAELVVPQSADQATVMKAFADATEDALQRGDVAAAEACMKRAIDYERGQKNWVSMINLEMDLVELLQAGAALAVAEPWASMPSTGSW